MAVRMRLLELSSMTSRGRGPGRGTRPGSAGQLERGWQSGSDEAHRRATAAQRSAEVEVQRILEVLDVLDGDRLIESQGVSIGRCVRCVCLGRKEQRGWITGQMGQDEGQGQDEIDGQQGLTHSGRNITPHTVPFALSVSARMPQLSRHPR